MLFFLLACTCPEDDTFVIRAPLAVFPSADMVTDGHLDIPELPAADTPFPVERLTWRQGFSVVQTAVIDVGAALDPSTLPKATEVTSSGSVQLWDLDDNVAIPCFAEIDAYPQDDEFPTLLVRPLRPMTPGHRVAVAVTTDVLTADGDPLDVPWFTAALDGRTDDAAHYQDLAATLDLDLAVAFDYPIADATAPMRAVADAVSIPTEWTWDAIADADVPGGWMRLEGRYTVDNWLVDDDAFTLADDGTPLPQGTAEADLYIFIPDAGRTAAPGSMPVWIFGHGIFGRPSFYLGDEVDDSGVIDVANRAGAIIIATVWRGLTYDDLPSAIWVGNDFGRVPELTDKLVQGVANTIALSRLITEGDLLQDSELMGLADPDQLLYYGISLGAIEGATMLALNDRIEHGVLHVGGSAWSTMLERSSNWPRFEDQIVYGIPSARDRQILYAASQLFWDPADPAGYTAELSTRSLLWQESIGDEQVPNMTTELLVRSVGATQLSPVHSSIVGLEAAPAPLHGPAIAQFDSLLALPDDTNRPAEVTGAHHAPRLWEGTKLQTLRFLDPDDPGIVEHFCGDAVCSADNSGE